MPPAPSAAPTAVAMGMPWVAQMGDKRADLDFSRECPQYSRECSEASACSGSSDVAKNEAPSPKWGSSNFFDATYNVQGEEPRSYAYGLWVHEAEATSRSSMAVSEVKVAPNVA